MLFDIVYVIGYTISYAIVYAFIYAFVYAIGYVINFNFKRKLTLKLTIAFGMFFAIILANGHALYTYIYVHGRQFMFMEGSSSSEDTHQRERKVSICFIPANIKKGRLQKNHFVVCDLYYNYRSQYLLEFCYFSDFNFGLLNIVNIYMNCIAN